jgi:hypothetical protein
VERLPNISGPLTLSTGAREALGSMATARKTEGGGLAAMASQVRQGELSDEDRALLERRGTAGAGAGSTGGNTGTAQGLVAPGMPPSKQDYGNTPEEPAEVTTSPQVTDAMRAVGDSYETQDPLEKPLPDWVVIPPDLKFPGKGKKVAFIRIRAEHTDTPVLGDRHCIIWGLTLGDEKLALASMRGEDSRHLMEMTMRSIRAIDGIKAVWDGKPGPHNVAEWYNAVGFKGRGILQNWWVQNHSLDPVERLDFFAKCIVVRIST